MSLKYEPSSEPHLLDKRLLGLLLARLNLVLLVLLIILYRGISLIRKLLPLGP